MQCPDPWYAARLARYGTVATRLSLLSDRRLGEVVAAAAPLGSGIGGRSAELDIDGTRTPFPAAEIGRARSTEVAASPR